MNLSNQQDRNLSDQEFFSSEHLWLENTYQQVKSAFDKDKMAHGLLMVAPEQSGKKLLAQSIAKSILCLESKTQLNKACGHCKNCSLVRASSHPDLSLIDCLVDNKGKQKKSIGIDQIRQLTNKLVETPQLDGWRVAIIMSVEKMTRGAFNAILKTLEEPGYKTLLIMLANGAHQVPATIKSRCQIFPLKLTEQTILPWLEKNTGVDRSDAQSALRETLYSPFAAMRYIETGEKEANERIVEDLDAIYQANLSPHEFLTRYAALNDVLWIQMANYFNKTLIFILKSNQGEYSRLTETLVSRLYSQLLEYNRAQCAGSNLQVNLQLEAILIQWFEMGKK